MLRTSLTALGLLALALVARPAGAFTLDFVALAAGNEHSFLSETFNNVDGSGIDVTGSARHLVDNDGTYTDAAPYGYLDDLSGGNPAGFGVCQTANCAGISDDNISIREVGILEFSTTVEITSISFNNGVHVDVYDGKIGVNVGASDPTTAETFSDIYDTALDLVAGVLGGLSLVGDRFQFVAPESFVGSPTGDTYKLYVESITFDEFTNVPEPGALALAGLGLMGLLVAGRGRRN